MQEEFPKYFDALKAHPRSLVGTQVPSIKGDGSMETLKDSADAADWQAAIKGMLVEEVNNRVVTAAGEMQPLFTTVHESIQLFQNNPDLVPRTKQFDPELANTFAKAAESYEVRQNGKLIGYSVPVQPIINALRTQLSASRAAAASPPAPTAQQQRVAQQSRSELGRWDAPQAGLQSRAGSSAAGEGEDAAGVLNAFLRQNGMSI